MAALLNMNFYWKREGKACLVKQAEGVWRRPAFSDLTRRFSVSYQPVTFWYKQIHAWKAFSSLVAYLSFIAERRQCASIRQKPPKL